MNKIQALVSDIQSIDNLSIVTFNAQDTQMKMMSLGLNISINIASKVTLGVKASSVMIAKDLSGMISSSNQLKCIVQSVNNGDLLSSIKLKFSSSIIESIITKDSSLKMNLQSGDNVLAIIKASELSIIDV